MEYDAIVVGARCAGSPLAMLLARRGYRVLLVDRNRFPSDTMSTLIIKYPGLQHLKEWGLLEQLLKTGCPPIRRWTDDKGDFALSGVIPPVDEEAMLAPRRLILDQLLVEAAVAAGVEFREDVLLTGTQFDGRRVTGIAGRTKSGLAVNERAKIVVGADGKHSKLADAVAAPSFFERPAQSCIYYSFWSGIPDQGIITIWRRHRFILAIPTHAGLTCLVVVWPVGEFQDFRRDIEANFWDSLRISPALYEAAREGRREERFIGTVDLPNAYRKPFGDGWALVGDAGHHEDPVLAHGISNAFHDAGCLAAALDSAWSVNASLPEALSDFERQRNESTLAGYERAVYGARLEDWDKPRELALRETLRTQPEDASLYFGVRAGVIPHAQFFNPRNIARILA